LENFMSTKIKSERRFLVVRSGLIAITGLCVLLVAAAANATLIGNDPSAEAWDFQSDGYEVLNFQTNHLFSQAGSVDSFTFFRGTLAGNPPYEFAALIVRPTGNADEYSVIFDSGTLDLTQSPLNTVGVQVVNFSPIAIQTGDIIASWGRGVAFDLGTGTGGSTTNFNDGTEFGTLKPSGTFTAPSAGYPALNQERQYALAFNFTPVPEPSSIVLAGAAVVGLSLVRRRRAI
jgi:hypothetical protein